MKNRIDGIFKNDLIDEIILQLGESEKRKLLFEN
jgi:hypothetical protein